MVIDVINFTLKVLWGMNKKPIISLKTARALKEKYGSPLYIYRKDIIVEQYKTLFSAIKYPNKKIYFACKANNNFQVLKLLKELGSGVEVGSQGEIEKSLKAGFKTKDISFTASNISSGELFWVAKKGIQVYLDSLNQLIWWGKANLPREVCLRLNIDFGSGHHPHVITGGAASKFGIWKNDLTKAIKIAKKFKLKIIGLHQHIGSNILNEQIFLGGVKLLLEIAKKFPDVLSLNIGGGIGVPYKPTDKPFNIFLFGSFLTKLFNNFCRHTKRNVKVNIEPGRYLVASSGALLVEVTDIKKTPGHLFVGVNSGFNHLIRHTLYGSYHHIFNLSRPKALKRKVLIVGNLCESGDILARQVIPLPKIGDLLVISDTGAYGYSMASDYNLRPKPKELFISN